MLDWGGTGRPIAFLAGLGNTAHVFDDFAPKFAGGNHVYGITRRGFGASSKPTPEGGKYAPDRLADDVLAVIEALKLERPVLIRHSIAGEELSSIALRHPEKVAGLVYLDAANSYAFYDPAVGDFGIDTNTFQQHVKELNDHPPGSQAMFRQLLDDLPRIQKDIENFQKELPPQPAATVSRAPAQKQPAPGSGAVPAASLSFEALQARMKRNHGGMALPLGELHQMYAATDTGDVGKSLVHPSIEQAVMDGVQKYDRITVPVLAFFAFNEANKEKKEEEAAYFERNVPLARVVRLNPADHYVFFSNEADVLREMRSFLTTLR